MKRFNGKFLNKSFISIDQITNPREINTIFDTADKMRQIVEDRGNLGILRGYCLAQLFYQPSTRTFSSFLAAAKWLGAITIPIHEMSSFSSAVKGESLEDTIRSIRETTACDAIIIRHPEDNSSEICDMVSKVPIINAGSGKKEHPTQAILDLYTIRQELKRIKNLKVAFVGDLKYGRTIKSLGKLLSLVDKKLELYLISPQILKMPNELVKEWKSRGVSVHETDNLTDVLDKVDVLYVTRIQKEWFEAEGKIELYQSLKGAYDVNLSILKKANKKMIIMHPLPRVGEIAYEVDSDPRAAYFRQMRNGLYARMALLKLILKG